MKLGDLVQITVGTTEDLQGVALFYEKLGYGRLDENGNWVMVTDGTNRLLLVEEDEPYRGLTYFSKDASERAETVDAKGVLLIDRRIEDNVFRATFYSPNSLPVTLIGQEPSTLPSINQEYLFRLGQFGEYSVPVADLKAALGFWQELGFELLHESSDPYPWAILGDGLMVLGLHQTDEFSMAALTYFAPDMAQIIADLKSEGFAFVEEMADENGIVGNAVLETPTGQRLFLFQGNVS